MRIPKLATMLPVAFAAAAAWGAAGVPDLGPNAGLNGKAVFPASDPWNQRIDAEPVDPNSNRLIDSIGRAKPLHPDFGASYNGGPFGIPYVVVPGNTPRAPVTFQYAHE